MNLLTGVLILIGVPLLCLAAGAPLACRLGLDSAGQRLASALLTGLMILLFGIATVSLVLPLSGWVLALVCAPLLLNLVQPQAINEVARDCRFILASRAGLAFAAGTVVALATLLWPFVARDGVIYYDGTSNHDAFFWIVGAEHLQSHTCLDTPALDAGHPLWNRVSSFTGWAPAYGRMGAEGYLAVVSGLTGQSTLHVYLWACAALCPAWSAATYLFARTFLVEGLRATTAFALAALQPIFAFYQHNGNLPNLLGMLAGAALLLAVEHGLRSGPGKKGAWMMLGGGALHALLCAYPEIAPFIFLPCGLLAARSLRAGSADPNGIRFRLSFLSGVAALGLVANAATAVRASHGFATAYRSASANEGRPNILGKSEAAEFIPTLLTLSPKTGKELGTAGGVAASFGLAAALFYVWHRARDRTGLAMALSGMAALAAYTALTGFDYGWQKVVQFSGVFLAAMVPVAAIELLLSERRRRRAALPAAAGLAAFYAYNGVIIGLDLWKWSGRKAIHAEWVEVAQVTSGWRTATVLVDAATFSQPFFHGMWAAYFLRVPSLVYSNLGANNAGYLEGSVAKVNEASPPRTVLAGRQWADIADAHSPRQFTGRTIVLLERTR